MTDKERTSEAETIKLSLKEQVDLLMADWRKIMKPVLADGLRRLGLGEEEVSYYVAQVYDERNEAVSGSKDLGTNLPNRPTETEVTIRRILGTPEEDLRLSSDDVLRRSMRRAFGAPEEDIDLSPDDFLRRGIRRAFGTSPDELDLPNDVYMRRRIRRAFGVSETDLDLPSDVLMKKTIKSVFNTPAEPHNK